MTSDTIDLQFWKWFAANQSMIVEVNATTAAELPQCLEELGAQLTAVADGLSFELGPKQATPREFIVSAGGITALIPTVKKLVAAAPPLPDIKVVAFRQPKSLGVISIEAHGKSVPLTSVKVLLEREVRKISATLYFEGFNQEEFDTWGDIGFLLLDSALGELTVMTQVGSVDFGHTDDFPEDATAIPLSQLKASFSEFCAEYGAELKKTSSLSHAERMKVQQEQFLQNDEMRWESISREGLIGEPLAVHYGFFTRDQATADAIAQALPRKFDGDVEVQREYTVAGEGLVVSGSTSIEPNSADSLRQLTLAMLEIAKEFNVEFDGYALQRAAQFSETDLFSMGCQQLLQSHRYREAIDLCEQGLSLHEDHPELLALYGYSLAKIGELDSAQVALEKLPSVLSTIEEGVPSTLWNAACAHAILGDHETAAHYLAQAIDSNPEFLELARTDPDFESIRSEPLFQQLLAN
jgi:tetratricopeptide (TPR) repeat protein